MLAALCTVSAERRTAAGSIGIGSESLHSAVEMDQSSANAELRPKNSVKCSARQRVNYSAELWQKFGITFAGLRLRRFVLI